MLPEFVDRTGGSQWGQAALPAAPPHNPQGILRIRRNQPLQSMAVDFVARIRGSQWNRALPGGGKWLRVLPNTKNLEALIYGRQIRVLFGGSQWVQAQPAGSRWVRVLPGQKSRLSNVAFYRNVRVWATVCSWPGSTRIMPGLWVSCWSQST